MYDARRGLMLRAAGGGDAVQPSSPRHATTRQVRSKLPYDFVIISL